MRAVWALLVAVIAVQGALGDVFGKESAERVQRFLQSEQGKNGVYDDAQETSAAVGAFALLKATYPNKDKACDTLKGQLAKLKAADVQTASHVISALEGLKCSGVTLSSDVKDGLSLALTGEALDGLCSAVEAVLALATGGHANLRDYDLAHAAAALADALSDEEGEASPANAARALGTLAALSAAGVSVNDKLAEAAGKVEAVLDAAGEALDLGGVSGASDFLRGVDAIAKSGTKVAVTDAQVRQLCEFLVDNQFVRDIADVQDVLAGLNTCADNALSVPLLLRLTQPNPKAGNIAARLTTVLDKAVGSATVKLVDAALEDGGAAVLSDVALSGDNGDYTLSSDKLNSAAPGFYRLRFAVSGLKGTYKTEKSIARRVKVAADVKPLSVGVWVSESAKSTGEGNVLRATHPNALPSKLSATHAHHLYVDVALTANFQPSQVFVQLSKGGKSAVFPAAPTTKKDENGHYVLRVNLGSSEFVESIFGSGDYDLTLIVGDALILRPYTWKLGTVSISLQAADKEDKHTDPFPKQDDIAHSFRRPDPRPPRIFALIFTFACAAPLGVLFLALLRFGLKLQFPTEPSEWLMAVLFQGSLAAILALFVLYWFSLTIFAALFMLCLLAPVAVYSGNQALKKLNRRSQPHLHTS